MRYNPKDMQMPGGNPGTYYFTVMDAMEMTSKAGNEMVKVVLSVDTGGSTIMVHDHLVSTPGGLWKVKMFCKEVGIDFESGNLAAPSCIGKAGKAVLDYDKKDLAKVQSGEIEKAYLRVQRYGVHQDEAEAESAVSAFKANPPVGENFPQDDCPF